MMLADLKVIAIKQAFGKSIFQYIKSNERGLDERVTSRF